jgi:hypothetical protein
MIPSRNPLLRQLRYLLLAFACLPACSKDKGEAPPTPSASVAAVAPPSDSALLAQLQGLAKDCSLDTASPPAPPAVNCKGGEKQRLTGEFVSNRRSKIAALDTFVVALSSADAKLQAVAASLLYDAFRSNLGTDANIGAVTPAQARRLLALLPKLPKALARQVAPAATHAGVLANDLEHLYQVLDADPTLGAAGYRYLMMHGRLNVFDKVKKLADDARAPVALAALEAPRNMTAWSEKDRAAICPWAQPLLASPTPMVRSKAVGLLSRCAGPYVDSLLTESEKHLTEHTLDRSHIAAHRDLCSAHRRRSGGATDEQCARNRKFLESATKDDKLETSVRTMALHAIAYQWPDAAALSLAKTLTKSQHADLAHAAKTTASRLERPDPSKPVPREPSPGDATTAANR